jgi:ABC-2 type transport system permease protein
VIRLPGYRQVLEKEVIEAWRTYRLVYLCALFVVIGIAAPLIVQVLPDLAAALVPEAEIGVGETGAPDVVDLLLSTLLNAGALAAVLLTMGAVAGEKERGTAWLVLSKPVSRAAFLWAKVVALGMIFALATGLAVVAAWLYSSLFFGEVPLLPWAQMAFIAWLSTMVYVSITFLGSVVAASPLGAAGFGLAAIVGLSLASAVNGLGPWLPTGLGEVAKALVLEEVSSDLDPARTVAVSFAVILVSMVLAWWRFRTEEI